MFSDDSHIWRILDIGGRSHRYGFLHWPSGDRVLSPSVSVHLAGSHHHTSQQSPLQFSDQQLSGAWPSPALPAPFCQPPTATGASPHNPTSYCSEQLHMAKLQIDLPESAPNLRHLRHPHPLHNPTPRSSLPHTLRTPLPYLPPPTRALPVHCYSLLDDLGHFQRRPRHPHGLLPSSRHRSSTTRPSKIDPTYPQRHELHGPQYRSLLVENLSSTNLSPRLPTTFTPNNEETTQYLHRPPHGPLPIRPRFHAHATRSHLRPLPPRLPNPTLLQDRSPGRRPALRLAAPPIPRAARLQLQREFQPAESDSGDEEPGDVQTAYESGRYGFWG